MTIRVENIFKPLLHLLILDAPWVEYKVDREVLDTKRAWAGQEYKALLTHSCHTFDAAAMCLGSLEAQNEFSRN